MKDFIGEALKKINEKNIVWFALTIVIVVLAILFLPSYFQKCVLTLEETGIETPYSKILIIIFYLSLGILIMKPVSSFLGVRKQTSNYRKIIKKIDNLPEEEFRILIQFAFYQRTDILLMKEHTHIARRLKAKGLLFTGYDGPDEYNGSEVFFMKDSILEYLTLKYSDQIDRIRS